MDLLKVWEINKHRILWVERFNFFSGYETNARLYMSLVSTVTTPTSAAWQADMYCCRCHLACIDWSVLMWHSSNPSVHTIFLIYTETSFTESPGQRVSTQHIASLVGIEIPRAQRLQTAIDWFKNSGLDCLSRSVYERRFSFVDCHRSSKT